MKKQRILFTGDSITDASRTDLIRGMEPWLVNATPERRQEATGAVLGTGYPLLVASVLGAKEPGRYEILNRGISGHRVVDLDARVKADCINLKPDVVSILIGVNDVWHELGGHNGVSGPKYRRVYDSMLQEIVEALPGVRLILMEPYLIPGSASDGCWEQFRGEVEIRRQAVRELAEKYSSQTSVTLLETQKLFDEAAARTCPSDWAGDGVHPTPAGHWLIAQEWLRLF